ncbi:MAG: DNA-directed RNA polymerase subunit K [Candidatus Burarchaeum sp.]|nr:DNA-directed RNA polymerase subunit K [Candidatus Burarchaeum sp.]MDO8340124.1 DNA-directed RNA polymerase subunit K [Candidatus Burarchaeum sp.]
MAEELNRFEKARIIGARALQLAMGAPPLIEVKDLTNPVNIAFGEFEKGVIPLVVIRDS